MKMIMHAVFCQDNIWSVEKCADILEESETTPEKLSANNDFRSDIFRPDVRHTFVSQLLSHSDSHRESKIHKHSVDCICFK